MNVRAKIANTARFLSGLYRAVSDDGVLGPNDTQEVQKLARDAGPLAERFVSAFSRETMPTQAVRNDGQNYAASVVSARGADGPFDNQALALGAPEGGGRTVGSTHVFSCYEAVFKMSEPFTSIVKVFENPFHLRKAGGGVSDEVATQDRGSVFVSADGQKWYPLLGKVGENAVIANKYNRIAASSRFAGGDVFSLRAAQLPVGFEGQFVKVVADNPNRSIDIDAIWAQ